ncbi:MAG: glycosyl hydrolase family 28 protein [Lentisphaeria bacterium]
MYIDIKAYGANNTGKIINTKTIQSALDACHKNKGGTVYFPAGKYLTGTLIVRSNTNVMIAAGAVILGSQNIDDYDCNEASFIDACGAKRGKGLILFLKAENVSLYGAGTINGQGDIFPDLSHRPMLLRFIECEDIRVDGITLKDSGAWVQHYFKCRNLTISNVTVDSYANANNDGLDLDCCQQVRVFGCHFRSGDDALTLKSTTDKPCRDIVISNCILSSNCNGLKFGTESIGDFENVIMTNCVIYDTKLGGITIAVVDGAKLKNVVISNITMRNVGTAIFIRLGNRKYNKSIKKNIIGEIENLTLENIYAGDAGIIGSSILGLKHQSIKNVKLKNINISSAGGCKEYDDSVVLPELMDVYPEFNRWGNFPAFGLYCRHVAGISLENCIFTTMDADCRPATKFEDVRFNERG